MSIVDTPEERSAERAQESASTVRSRGSRRRRLSQDEEQAIAQLYAEASTPTAAIRERFGLSESTLYRVVQRHGVALRGRTRSSTPSTAQRPTAPAPRRRSSRGGETAADSQSAARPGTRVLRTGTRTAKQSTRGPAQRATAIPGRASAARSTFVRNGGAAQQQFRLQFLAESVFHATDVRDALRQAESLGAVEITAVTRQT